MTVWPVAGRMIRESRFCNPQSMISPPPRFRREAKRCGLFILCPATDLFDRNGLRPPRTSWARGPRRRERAPLPRASRPRGPEAIPVFRSRRVPELPRARAGPLGPADAGGRRRVRERAPGPAGRGCESPGRDPVARRDLRGQDPRGDAPRAVREGARRFVLVSRGLLGRRCDGLGLERRSRGGAARDDGFRETRAVPRTPPLDAVEESLEASGLRVRPEGLRPVERARSPARAPRAASVRRGALGPA